MPDTFPLALGPSNRVLSCLEFNLVRNSSFLTQSYLLTWSILPGKNPYGFQWHDYSVRFVMLNVPELYNDENISGRNSEHY